MKTLIEVPYTSIVIDDTIGYRDYTSEANTAGIKELANSISAQGLQQPPGGYLDKEGRPHLVVGFRRYKAIGLLREKQAAKYETIQFLQSPEPSSKADVIVQSITSNEQSPPTLLELGFAVGQLIDASWTQTQVGTALGKSQASISRSVWLNSLPEAVKAAIKADKISIRAALEYMGDKKDGVTKLLAIVGGADPSAPENTPAAGRKGGSKDTKDAEASWKDVYDERLDNDQTFMGYFQPQPIEGEAAGKDYLSMTKDELQTGIANHIVWLKRFAKAHQVPLYVPVEAPEGE